MGAARWLAQHTLSSRFDRDKLIFVAFLEHPATKQKLQLVGDMNGYKAVPPAWTFVDVETGELKRSAWPKGEVLPETGGASIFIDHHGPVICAPFNRLAYEGPHKEWGAATGWLQLNLPQYVRATTIGDMLAVIDLHLLQSKGCMT